jgi:Fe-S-cluster containining protein
MTNGERFISGCRELTPDEMSLLLKDDYLKEWYAGVLCLSCMACCKVFVIPIRLEDTPERCREVYEARGYEFKYLEPDKALLVSHSPCPHLTEGGCDIYDTRPQACRDYDGRHDPWMKGKCLWGAEYKTEYRWQSCGWQLDTDGSLVWRQHNL